MRMYLTLQTIQNHGCSLHGPFQSWYAAKARVSITDRMKKLETWSRWDGGAYHVWDEKNKVWIRNPDILADTATGNIGWDMMVEQKKGKNRSRIARAGQGRIQETTSQEALEILGSLLCGSPQQ